MSFVKERTTSLGSVALRRTRRDTEPEVSTTGENAMVMSSSERTFVSTTGTASRRAPRTAKSGQLPSTATVSRPGGPRPEEPTYRLGPADDDARFIPAAVESLVQQVLVERLQGESYDPTGCKQLSQELAATIMEELKALHIRRYKMVAVVSIGSLHERPGLQFGSRCLWDQATDSFVSVKYTNGSLFAVAMIYGLYYE